MERQERQDFLMFIERLDHFAVGLFRQFRIEEGTDRVVLVAPTETYKMWAIEYINNRLKNYVKKIEVKSADEAKNYGLQESYYSNLVERFTFENFVVGKANELAYKVCLEVAEKPGTAFNPLFLYGNVGLGKTHLLHALGNMARNKGYKVIYSSINDFSDEMVEYLRKGNIGKFREKYMGVDLILLDDVQFLTGKERTQVELFRLFESMYLMDKQIALVSDRHPNDLRDVSDRLISRFEGGLVLEIGLDDETKLSIIRQKLILYGLPVDKVTMDYIFDSTGHNVREIEGAIKALKITGIKPLGKDRTEKNVQFVVEFVAKHFGLKPDHLSRDTKERRIISAKQIAMYLCKAVLGISYTEISRQFGRRDHTWAIYSIKRVEERAREDRKFKYMLSFLEKQLRKGLDQY
ncbi:MAG: chromosomal replication initiator protein DnaA [Aquificaceae bacterium]